MNYLLRVAALVLLCPLSAISQHFTYPGQGNEPGLHVVSSDPGRISLTFSITEWTLADVEINRENLKKVELAGHFLPNDEGAPDLPGSGRLIAVPQGARPRLNILAMETETLHGVDLSPAPRIPKTTENGPLHYAKDQAIWSSEAFYPSQPARLSETTQIRGVDMVMLGITPFQYNPVARTLVIIKNIDLEVTFEGGNGQFGTDRLRSRWWDPLLKDALLNGHLLPEPDYSQRIADVLQDQGNGNRTVGYEYLVICPDDSVFMAWADTIRVFRNKQGIHTGVVTTAQMGGNTVTAIESYINNAYNTWDIPPAAVLILGDYGTTGATVVAPIWDNYCASDNIYADVTGNNLPDIVFARMTAQNANHLEIMINKFRDYETNPPTYPGFYDHPITALGWQTERWFQICIEVVGGFFRNELGKDPVRINEIYAGNPAADPWSTATNTTTIMNYFGPNGLGYIPATPGELGNWNGGSATQINNAINDGAFLLLHRDHGYELGWGEPAYSNSSMSGLNNAYLPFVYSVNCLTGKYNYSSECFTEAFHRRPQRALGLVAASEVSYSFVNDTYVWGAFDNMWPEFMPSYGTTPASRGLLPAFSNAAGKIFLQQSGWPYNTSNKTVTYHLFHHHGDAFSTLYSEVPQDLLVIHNGVLVGGAASYTVQADTSSLIALSVEGEIIGVADGTGTPVEVVIPPQLPGTTVDLVVTKRNYFRYETAIPVISPNAPFVVYEAHNVNDGDGNGNGLADYAESSLLSLTMANLGLVDAEAVTVTITSTDPFVAITDDTAYASLIAGGESVSLTDGFAITVADSVPDQHMIFFQLEASDADTAWTSHFYLLAHAPVFACSDFQANELTGNGNGRIDPGETAEITFTMSNTGSSAAFNVISALSCPGGYISVITQPVLSDELAPGASVELSFTFVAGEDTPGGYSAVFEANIQADYNRSGEGNFTLIIGQYSALILDLEPAQSSGPAILAAFENMDLYAHYLTVFPDDLGLYRSVFLCLGTLFSQHVLTGSQAQLLNAYLDEGGKLYMEGRKTWYEDPQTTLHPRFNIGTEFTNWYVFDTIYGIPGSFTEGMKFDFDANQPYNNYILHAIGSAFPVLNSLPGSRGAMVAHDEGSYKTVGANFEMGALVDGEHPSTKTELVRRILTFFGDIITGTHDHASLTRKPGLQVFPNPAQVRASFLVTLDRSSQVSLQAYDITGRRVAEIFEGRLPAGTHPLVWNPTCELSSGIYFIRLSSPGGTQTEKLFINID